MDLGRKQLSQSLRDVRPPGSLRNTLYDNFSTNSDNKSFYSHGSASLYQTAPHKRDNIAVRSQSHGVSANQFSYSSQRVSEFIPIDDLTDPFSSTDDELPSVNFDTNQFDDDFRKAPISFDQRSSSQRSSFKFSDDETSNEDSRFEIPIFTFTQHEESSPKSPHYERSSQGSFHTKAPPISSRVLKDSPPTTTTTTTGFFKEQKFSLFTDTDTTDSVWNSKQYTDRNIPKLMPIKIKEQKPPPTLPEEKKLPPKNPPKYEAPLQRAAEAYRIAAQEEKERQQKLEEEKENQQKIEEEKENQQKIEYEKENQQQIEEEIIPRKKFEEEKAIKRNSPISKQKSAKRRQKMTLDENALEELPRKSLRTTTNDFDDISLNSLKNEPHSMEVKGSKPHKLRKKRLRIKKKKVAVKKSSASEEMSYEEDSLQNKPQNKASNSDERPPPISTPISTFNSTLDTEGAGKAKQEKEQSKDELNLIGINEEDLEDLQFSDEEMSLKSVRTPSLEEEIIEDGSNSVDDFDLDDDESPFKFQRPTKRIPEFSSTKEESESIVSLATPEAKLVGLESSSSQFKVDTNSETPELGSISVQENETDPIFGSRVSTNIYDSTRTQKTIRDFNAEEIELESLPIGTDTYSSSYSKSSSSTKQYSSSKSLMSKASYSTTQSSTLGSIKTKTDTLESLSSNAVPAQRTFRKKEPIHSQRIIDNTSGIAPIPLTGDIFDTDPEPVRSKHTRSAEATHQIFAEHRHKKQRNSTFDVPEPVYKPHPRRHSKTSKAVSVDPVGPSLNATFSGTGDSGEGNLMRMIFADETSSKESEIEYTPLPIPTEEELAKYTTGSFQQDYSISDISTASLSTKPAEVQEGVKKRGKKSKKVRKQNDSQSFSSMNSDIATELPTVPATNMEEDTRRLFKNETYWNTQPTVSKKKLLNGREENWFIQPIENPTEPVKGWIRFQVGLIPDADTENVEQKAAEKFSLETLLKQIRGN